MITVKIKKMSLSIIDLKIFLFSTLLFGIGGVFFLFYRFIFIELLKNKIKINLLYDKIVIETNFLNKEILFDDIKKIQIIKNISNSYDIIINFDLKKYFFKYTLNYIFDFDVNEKYTNFVLSDIENIDEVENFLLKKININYIEKKYKKKQKLYNIYSITDKYIFEAMIFFFIYGLFIYIRLERSFFEIILILLLFNIKILKEKYSLIYFDRQKILIQNIKESKKLYVISDFDIERKKNKDILKIKYNLKYFSKFFTEIRSFSEIGILPSQFLFDTDK